MSDRPDFELDDDALRQAGTIKWVAAEPGVLPAWVAELDVVPCPAVTTALRDAVNRGAFGYPPPDSRTGLPEATAAFQRARFGWDVDPALIIATGDVMNGIELALDRLCAPGPVVVPTPSYPPFLADVPLHHRELITVPMIEPDENRPWRLDLERIDAALSAGGTSVLLANPYNPVGRVFAREELEALRDVVSKHGARVISDEIHAPLVYDTREHVPYASLDGTSDHVTTIVAASKAWNLPGLKCAQVIFGSQRDLSAITSLHHVANHGVSSLGITASIAAYTDGQGWLDGLVEHLQARRDQVRELLRTLLPQVTWTPPEGTYLAWLDLRATGIADPAAVALAKGNVMVQAGGLFGSGYEQFVRLNFGTSDERLTRIIAGLATAWS